MGGRIDWKDHPGHEGQNNCMNLMSLVRESQVYIIIDNKIHFMGDNSRKLSQMVL